MRVCATIPRGRNCGTRRSFKNCCREQRNARKNSWRRDRSRPAEKKSRELSGTRIVELTLGLDPDHAGQLLHSGGALVEASFLLGSQLDLYDLLDSLRS